MSLSYLGKHSKWLAFWFCVGFLLMQGCSTPYQAEGFTGGYTDTQLDHNVFRVSFRGNGYTSRQQTADFTLLRSAELVLKNGYSHFAIVSESQDTDHSAFVTPIQTHTDVNIYGSGYSTYGTATSYTTGGNVYFVAKPSASNVIMAFTSKPDSIFTYDASIVYESISRKYDLNGSK